jgi:hypothetical protein
MRLQVLGKGPMGHGPKSSFYNHEGFEGVEEELNPFGMKGISLRPLMAHNHHIPSFNLQMKIP